MHFGENQLFPSLIGLSPLPTAHPPGFQPWWVRASTRSYPRFTLAMGSSLGFGYSACDTQRPHRLAFAPAPPQRVNLPHTTNSQAHSSKGTPSPKGSDGSLAHGFRNSFTPLPGYFSPFPHGTLHYRSPGSISTYQVVLADSRGIPRVPRYSGQRPRAHTTFAYGSITRSARAFQHVQLAMHTSPPGRQTRLDDPTTPNTQRPPAFTRVRFSLFPFRSPLLRESLLLPLPVGTEMFQFPTFPPLPYTFKQR